MARKKKETTMETNDAQAQGAHETATALAEAPQAPVEAPPLADATRPEQPPANGTKQQPLVRYRLSEGKLFHRNLRVGRE